MMTMLRREETPAPSVSVVIPFYGSASELQTSIASLQCQTRRDIEVIVVADGCLIDDEAVCSLREKKVPVQIIRLPKRQGPFQARTVGAERSTGEHLWFLDHDDYVEPDFVEQMLARSLESEADIVECPFIIEKPGERPYLFQRFGEDVIRREDEILEKYMIGESHNNLANKLIRRALWIRAMEKLEELGAPSRERLIFCEDLLCTIILYSMAHRYASTRSTAYHYIQREGSTMNDLEPNTITECLKSLEVAIEIIWPLLTSLCSPVSLQAFRRRELDWAVEELLGRACNCLGANEWALVAKIQRHYIGS